MFVAPPQTQAVPDQAQATTPMRKPRFARLRDIARFAAAGSVLALGVLAILGQAIHLQSDNAVVSASRVLLRAPITGIVETAPPGLHARLGAEDVVAEIDNPRASRTMLNDLQARLAANLAQQAAGLRRRAALLGLRDSLLARTAAHGKLAVARTAADLAAARAQVIGRQAQMALTGRDLARRRTLAGAGFVAQADLERSQAAADAATQDVAAGEAAVRALEVELQAAHALTTTTPGATEIAYTAQRADEIALLLIEADAALANLAAEQNSLQERVADALEATARTRHAVIRAGSAGMIWRPVVHAGEYVTEGAVIAEMVSCADAVVLAAIRQRDIPSLAMGGQAEVRLAGEHTARSATIMEAVSDSTLAGDLRMVAVPGSDRGPAAYVMLKLDQGDDGPESCTIGRAVQVVLPQREGRWFGWLARLF